LGRRASGELWDPLDEPLPDPLIEVWSAGRVLLSRAFGREVDAARLDYIVGELPCAAPVMLIVYDLDALMDREVLSALPFAGYAGAPGGEERLRLSGGASDSCR